MWYSFHLIYWYWSRERDWPVIGYSRWRSYFDKHLHSTSQREQTLLSCTSSSICNWFVINLYHSHFRPTWHLLVTSQFHFNQPITAQHSTHVIPTNQSGRLYTDRAVYTPCMWQSWTNHRADNSITWSTGTNEREDGPFALTRWLFWKGLLELPC